ncbi:MAG: UdgX family uracil-DNA binding protein [Sphingobium sp.]|nr:UdgX family uracil-DNA binding protein [Sphingobium sp.]
MRRAVLRAPDDFDDWRNKARAFLGDDIPPEQIVWSMANDAAPDLFATDAVQFFRTGHHAPTISRDLLDLLRTALLHREPSRFALAYRLLWRMQSDRGIAGDPSDPDVIAIRALAKGVRRDIHKMHAFLRFRKVGDAGGREQFAAWFEPEHHITRAVAGFFRDRFTSVDWLIVTPEASIGWDGIALREGPGGQRGDVPDADAVEAEWRTYYASIFNPARLKTHAMKKEMPLKYWHNLPEADLIPALVRNAETRVSTMIDLPHDLELPAMARTGPNDMHADYGSLDALYRALCEEDVAPSPGFSERIVLGEGPAHAAIMLVGEQPGDQEDQLDRPFVGPAGKLLDDCLTDAKISRADSFLTNAVKRFKFSPRGKRRLHQTPTAGDVTHYRWWLEQEVRLVNPSVVVALGATALHALSGRKQTLGPVRGQLLPWENRLLLPTVHPSFLLRLRDEQGRAIEREKFVRDLRKAAETARSR